MGVSRHLVLGKLIFPGSADQRQHDSYTLRRGTGFLLRTPVQVSFLLGLRQEFAAGLLAHLQRAKQIETPVHKLCGSQGPTRPELIDHGPNTRQGRITQKLGGEIDSSHESPTIYHS